MSSTPPSSEPFPTAVPSARIAFDRAAWQMLGASLVLHLIAACCSVGFHHPDEHFQILELVRFKLAGTGEETLAWEYAARIRPWLQPFLYCGLAKPLLALGIASPFSHALVFRLASALLGFVSLVLFARACLPLFAGARQRSWLVAGLSFMWLLPYLHARTSSENLTTSFFLLGLSLLPLTAPASQESQRWIGIASRALGAGVLFGLAFSCRYQTGLLIVGAGAWLLASRRFSWVAWTILGTLAAVSACLVIDKWGYGAWTLTPWRYFAENIVEQRAAAWGVEPWWYYLTTMAVQAPPLGLLFVLFVPWAWIKRPLHALSLTTLPYFVVHSLLGHKELRFLFPLAPLAVPLLLVGLSSAAGALARFVPRTAGGRRRTLGLVFVPNLLYLAVLTVKPVRNEYATFRGLYNHSPVALEVVVVGKNPYELNEMGYTYYAPQQLSVTKIEDVAALPRMLAARTQPMLVHLSGNTLPPEAAALNERCTVLHRTYPVWLQRFDFNGWMRRTHPALVLECRPGDS